MCVSDFVAHFYKAIFKKWLVCSFTRVLATSGLEETWDAEGSWAALPAKSLPPALEAPTGLIPNQHLSKITNTSQKQGLNLGFVVRQASI